MNRKQIAASSIALPIVVGAIIAFFSPLEIADYSVAKRIVETAQIIFPTVSKMKGGYPLDNVSLFYFSTIWLLTPLTLLGCSLYLEEQKEKIVNNCTEKKWASSFFSVLFFPTILLIATFANFETTDVTDVRAYLTYQTRLGLAFMGFWIPLGAAMFLAICLLWWMNIRQILFISKEQ